jgi:two-component system chemotaxis sensor kinase CheA
MIDVSQFHAVFLEESTEHLADLESGLLELEQHGETDMNAIFRAAHSIKGGAATFGFDNIADFTHVVESVLEKSRDGEIPVSEDLTTLLLSCLDIISEMVDAAKEERDAKVDNIEECLEGLNSYLSGGSTKTEELSQKQESKDEKVAQDRVLNITLKPKPHFPQTGSEMISIIKELETLGDVDATCYPDKVPPIQEINPEDMYLWWEIELVTDTNDDVVHDVFMFVEDDVDIKIETIASFDKPGAPIGDTEEKEVTATPMPERRESAERRDDNKERRKTTKKEVSIRVSIDKVDSLINLVGELITTQAMVEQHTGKQVNQDENNSFDSAMNQLASHTRNLQEAIMGIRMMPIDFAFSRFPRMVRDTASKLGKKVKLETSGSHTELDKTVIEKISDPLTHLVRNSVDHGIETIEKRAENNKPEEGIIHLAAFYRGGNVIIEVRDDGAGLSRERILAKAVDKGLFTEDVAKSMSDNEVWKLIFDSGFSTAAEVTDVSGRGVGMDVVRKNIQELGGTININSETGIGTCFTISLPLTLAIVDGMTIRVGKETYMVPILNIIESIRLDEVEVQSLQGGVEVVNIRGDYLPLVRLSEVFQVHDTGKHQDISDGIVIIAESDQTHIALFVDELLGERQVVIKSIEDNYRQVEGISGATILGDGTVALIVDLPGLVKVAKRDGRFVKIPENIKSNKIEEAAR